MAASSISMLALLLLMSAVTPGVSTEGEGSQDHTVNALIIAMREVSRALEGFDDTVQEGLRQQRQYSDALTDLHTLTATVLRVEERINQQNGKIESLKEKIEDITKVGDLQRQLDEKTSENERNVDKVESLTQEIEYLKNQLHNENHTVQDLGRNLDESRRYAEKLELLVQQLNNTLESKKKDVPVCAEQPPQKIKNLVLQFSGSGDWQMLERGLDAEMDHSSVAYGELKNMSHYSGTTQFFIGYYGYTQLATLLLCAGMPVDLPDNDTNTLLHGAAYGGHYQLAEMLLSCGADVNARNINRQTPLHWAAYQDHLETVKLLVQAGADTTARTTSGRNVLDYAKDRRITAVQQYLEQLPA